MTAGRLDLPTVEAGKRLIVEHGPDGLLRLSVMTATGDVAGAVLTPGAVDDLATFVAAYAQRHFEETTAGEFIGKRGDVL